MATPLTDEEITQLRELLNNTNPLKDQPILDVASEAGTAILGAVHNDTETGRLRKLGMAILHQALQAANPLELNLVKDTLVENVDGSSRSNFIVNLDDNFSFDNYLFFSVLIEANNIDKKLYTKEIFEINNIPIKSLRGTTPGGGSALRDKTHTMVWLNNTSFTVEVGGQSGINLPKDRTILNKLIGYRYTMALSI